MFELFMEVLMSCFSKNKESYCMTGATGDRGEMPHAVW